MAESGDGGNDMESPPGHLHWHIRKGVASSAVFALSSVGMFLLSQVSHHPTGLQVPKPSNSKNNGSRPPLHIYILAGQSNMLGFGSKEHMDVLLNEQQGDDRVNPYAHLFDHKSQQWSTHDRVYVTSATPKGRLTMGQGMNSSFFGPELGFGWSIAEATPAADILLIKTAWDGHSLCVNFRPPSVEIGNYTNFRGRPIPRHRYGGSYRRMVEIINATANNLTRVIPHYYSRHTDGDVDGRTNNADNDIEYEFKGFVWFQGWSDRGTQKRYEYANNLAHLIRDVRLFLQTPDLPVVIGGTGQNVQKAKDKAVLEDLRRQQESVTRFPDLKNSSRFVPTQEFNHPNRTVTYGVRFHYSGYADTVYDIGRAFGLSMLELVKRHPLALAREILVDQDV